MFLEDMKPEDVANLVTKGIGSDFEEMIYATLKAQAEETARKVAKEIADRLAGQVVAVRSPMDLQLKVDMRFNMVDMNTDAAGEVVAVQNGVPVIAWKGDPSKLEGKKLFVAK